MKETYLKQVKVIYIDPPYNTGKDFVYQDNFTESISVTWTFGVIDFSKKVPCGHLG